MSVSSLHALPVGDPRRPMIGRVAFGTLVASADFFVFTTTKQIRPVYLHAPWLNDPYDTVFSFTMFFVPLLAAVFLIPVSLCLKSEPLPIGRVVTVVRGCRVTVGAIVIELLAAWAAVVVRANGTKWTAATAALIGLLVLCSVVTGKVVSDLVRAPRIGQTETVEESQATDWLGDLVTAGRRESRRLGPLRGPALSALAWTEQSVLIRVRRHPLVAAAVISATFAVIFFGWQAVREGYVWSFAGLEMGLGFCGMFAFLTLAGSYLQLVRAPARLYGARRRAVDAAVVACTAAVAVLAFRDSLWWIIDSNTSTAGLAQFAVLLGSTTVLAFVLVFAAETLLRAHRRTNHPELPASAGHGPRRWA